MDYVYQFKDHLGNIRLSYSDRDKDGKIDLEGIGEDLDNDGRAEEYEIVQEKNYYPFGLEHEGYNNTISGREHPYKFQGVEYNEDLGLNLYEMDWRQYDPAIGRFTSIDPLTEARDWLTPYNFVQNNPILRIDPTGLLDDYGVDQNGKVELIKETDDDTDTLYSVTRDNNGDLVKDQNGEVVKNDTNGDGEVADGDSVTVDKGVLNNIENTTYTDPDGITHNIQIMDVTSLENVQPLFEFMADNSINEIAYSEFFTNSKKFISTSFNTNSEQSMNILFPRYRYLLHHVHSHPDPYLAPSTGDTTSAGIIKKRTGINTRFEIYSSFLKQYKDYNENSASFELEEVIITN